MKICSNTPGTLTNMCAFNNSGKIWCSVNTYFTYMEPEEGMVWWCDGAGLTFNVNFRLQMKFGYIWPNGFRGEVV